MLSLTLTEMIWAFIASDSMPCHQMNVVSVFIPADCETNRALFQSFVFCSANEYLLLATISIAFANDRRSILLRNLPSVLSQSLAKTPLDPASLTFLGGGWHSGLK